MDKKANIIKRGIDPTNNNSSHQNSKKETSKEKEDEKGTIIK